MAKSCECGCGTEIAEAARFALGHHWRVKRAAAGIPDTKTCAGCGKVYSRRELANPQSNKHWLERKYCSEPCRAEHANEFVVRGEDHPGWKGDAASPGAGRTRALRQYTEKQPCEICGSEKSERHHVDGEPRNNAPENVRWLCRRHHIQVEDRMAYRRAENTLTPEQLEARAQHKLELARRRKRDYMRRKRTANRSQ